MADGDAAVAVDFKGVFAGVGMGRGEVEQQALVDEATIRVV